MKKFLGEFKDFISRGNVMDMAIGVILGGAFGKIVTSLVEDIIMPVIASIIGSNDFSKIVVKVGIGEEGPVIMVGNFIQNVVNFLIIAFVIFVFIRQFTKLKEKIIKKEQEAPTTKACPYCKSSIDIEASRCPHCTSEL